MLQTVLHKDVIYMCIFTMKRESFCTFDDIKNMPSDVVVCQWFVWLFLPLLTCCANWQIFLFRFGKTKI